MALYTPSGNPTNASRGLASVLRSEFTLIAAGINAIAAEVLTLTNKTINLTNNTLTGTKAQFNTACSDGNFLYDGGDIGTPSAGVLTNCTGLPVASGISGLGSGVASFLATPTSANLAAALSDEEGVAGKVPFISYGTWPPSWTTSNSDSVVSALAESGTYVRIGKLYLCTCAITVNTVTSAGTGVLQIDGLPATPATGVSFRQPIGQSTTWPTDKTPTLMNIEGTQRISLYRNASSSVLSDNFDQVVAADAAFLSTINTTFWFYTD